MKSAYELAMERLAKSDPDGGSKLTPEKKARLAELDLVYKGKIAEREIFLKKRIDEALNEGKLAEVNKIVDQIASERARLEEEREDEKERVRRSK
jgi:predicted phage-related endonuclease